MYKLKSKTTLTRVTVSTAAVELVPAENELRRITILPVPSPSMNFAIDQTADDIADTRAYYWAPLPTYPIPAFLLQPGQCIFIIATDSGESPVGVICEYLES
jgi:hypothetical protein